MQIPLIDELRDARRRLSERCQNDLELYVRYLKEVATSLPGIYVRGPKLPVDAPADASGKPDPGSPARS